MFDVLSDFLKLSKLKRINYAINVGQIRISDAINSKNISFREKDIVSLTNDVTDILFYLNMGLTKAAPSTNTLSKLGENLPSFSLFIVH